MTETQDKREIANWKKPAGWAAVGFTAGVLLTVIVGWSIMPGMMIVTEESRLNVDDTVALIEKAVVEQGWVVSGTTDMNRSLAKHGVEFGPRVKVVKLCKPEYAQSVLKTDPDVACLMPCSIAVWESDDGRVYVSKMNTGLMGKMFGGNIAKVMGGQVAEDEHAMLAGILR